MNSKNVIDLSPKIFRIVSVISIITIIIHVMTDIIYVGSIDHKAIVLPLLLFIFSENSRENSIDKRNS
ncbi:hypothetical protein [Senegalia massiliensis]|uniref:Uncharacterized protein n=1 Tax=Senegalia massiliensis TaxID=1720316 RepID=A0A845R775_9CLOT|nr:hypothetical protein [Senegalia massiliensis]NBI08343.1 hypothetical protein [Senegalia massiliensis]